MCLKSEIHSWAHYLVRNKKIVKFCVYRPWSLDMRCAYAPQPPPPAQPAPPPPGPSPPATTCQRHATETDGVGEGASLVHAPRYPYRLGVRIRVNTVW
jgi:hypothetical protein